MKFKKIITNFLIISVLVSILLSNNILADSINILSINNFPPDKPCNIHPNNGAIDIPINVTLIVCCNDPDGNKMNISFYNAQGDILIGIHNNVSTGFPGIIEWSNLEYNTTYTWYAIANDSKYENKSNTWMFKTEQYTGENRPPNKPSNPSPSNNSVDVGLNPVLSVAVSDPDGGLLDVSFYDASDDSLISVDSDVISGGTASVNWYGLSENTSYSWYAIVNDSKYENKSNTWMFKTEQYTGENRPPNKPSNPSPSNNSVDVGLNPVLSVAVSDPDGGLLDVSFYDASDDSLISVDSDVISGGTASVNWYGLSKNTSYSWCVIVDDSENTTISDTWNFTTSENPPNNPPYEPTNPSPSNGMTGIGFNPVLSVVVSDPDIDFLDVSFYDASDDSLISVDSNVVSGGTASVTWSGLNENTIYRWYVIVDDSKNTTKSDTWNFKTIYIKLKIDILGGIGVNAFISNIGDDDAKDVEWDISIKSIFGFIDESSEGNVDVIKEHDDIIAKKLLVLGFGLIDITVNADCIDATKVTETAKAILIGYFIFLY